MEKIIEINSLDELDRVAQAVIDSLDGRTVVAFDAPMGAGKTTLISRIAALLGSDDDVTSPTFAIVNQYEGSRTIYHFDMYRIDNADDLETTGFFDYPADESVFVIEWSENISDVLPEGTIYIDIRRIDDNTREIIVEGDERFEGIGN